MNHANAVEFLLFAALKKAAGAERNAFLDSECANDAELRRQVERLLKAEARAGDFLKQPVLEQWEAPESSHESNRTTDHTPAAGTTDVSHPATDAPACGPLSLPGYRVLREIARGGMGRVLAARDLTLDRDIALKVLLPGANPDRFVRESKITARLAHPGIPPVHELGTMANGSPFLAMKLIAGQTLAVEIKTADRPRLLQVFTQVCQAVGFAHSKGVVHRDLKPANIMVGAFGEVQVMDWGLAKEIAVRSQESGATEDGDAASAVVADIDRTTYHRTPGESTDDQTQAGTILGTPAYMPPEQARGEACEAWSDVFALGGILCTILTGQAPYSGKTSVEVIRRARSADLGEAHTRLDGCGADAELVALCRRCLSVSPADRPVDGQAVADGLTTYLDGVQQQLQTAQRERAVAVAREAEQRKRRKVQLALASTLVALLLGGGAFAWWRNVQVQESLARDARTDEGMANHLEQGEQALRANDPARARVALEAAEKRKAEPGAEKHAERLARLQSDLVVLIGLVEFDEFTWTMVGDDLPEDDAEQARLRKVLAQYGLTPKTPPEEASQRVKDSAVRDRLVAALDHWLNLEKLPWIRDVLKGADAHPYRDAFRDGLLAVDKAVLKAMGIQPQAAEQPPGFVAVLGQIQQIPVGRRRELLTLALRDQPRDLTMLMVIGNSYLFKEGEVEDEVRVVESVRWFQAAVAVAPESGAANLHLGIALLRKGDVDGAIAYFRKAAKLAPEASSIHDWLIGALLDQGDPDGAIAGCRQWIELDPTNAAPYLLLAKALKAKGDVQGVIDSYRKAIELEPDNAEIYYNLGNALRDQGDLAGAIVQYREAIELDPKDAAAHNNLGFALKDKGDLAGAIVHYRNAIELDPKRHSTHNNLAIALQVMGDLAGAIFHYRKAIELKPNYAIAYYNLGTALSLKGDPHATIDAFRTAIRLDPKYALERTLSNRSVVAAMAKIVFALGRPELIDEPTESGP